MRFHLILRIVHLEVSIKFHNNYAWNIVPMFFISRCIQQLNIIYEYLYRKSTVKYVVIETKFSSNIAYSVLIMENVNNVLKNRLFYNEN